MKTKFIIYSLLVLSIYANGDDFSVSENTLMYKGHVIDSSFNIGSSNFRKEAGVLAQVDRNNFNDFELIQIVSEQGELEIWLFNEQIEGSLLKVGSYITDLSVDWLANNIINVSRSHMGLSTSFIIELDLSDMTYISFGPIGNMLHFNAATNKVVRYEYPSKDFKTDSLVVTNLKSNSEQIIELDISYKYRSQALELFKDVAISNGNLRVEIKELQKESRIFVFPLN